MRRERARGESRRAGRRGDRCGFVMPFVVFMLFAVAIAGATGYLVVSSEFALSTYSSEGAEALTIARAGLERFVAEQLGSVADTAEYALGNGIAVVTTRKVLEQDSDTDVYFVRSEATVLDPRTADTPARRVVGAYALHRLSPLSFEAAVMIGADRIDVRDGGMAVGDDQGACGGGNTGGAVARLTVTEELNYEVSGNPEIETWSAGWQTIADTIGVRWDVLSDPDFPFEFENSLPDFGAMPADSFPLIRYTGWTSASWSGRGVLVVDGVFDPESSFSWDGVVLAKHVDDIVQGDIDGILIGGLEEPNMYDVIDFRTDVRYNSCYVEAANEMLSHLELIEGTVHETS